MNLYVVIDRVDGMVEGVWEKKEHAEEYAASFNCDNFYDMQVMEYYLRTTPLGEPKERKVDE